MLHDITQYAIDSQTCRYSNQLYGSVKKSLFRRISAADEVLFLVACACNFVC